MDWNSDGLIDLISGENNGTVHLFINVGTASDPVLTDAGLVYVGGAAIDVGSYSMPCTVNWNNDRPFDLVVGDSEGRLRYYINDGTVGNPHFSTEQLVQDGGADLDVGGRSAPCVADMDGNGLFDLVVGDSVGNILLFRNQGVPGSPQFSGSVALGVTGAPINVSYTARPDVTDWNDDGLLDLVSGGFLGVPQLYLGSGSQIALPEVDVVTLTWYVPPQGGWVDFEVTVTNPNNTPVTFDFFTTVQCSSVGFRGPLMNHQNLTLGPGQQGQATLHQYLPGPAPSDMYLFTVFLGQSATWTFTNLEYFSVLKM